MRLNSAFLAFLGPAALVTALLAGRTLAQPASSVEIVAVDADITGNTATSIGPLNGCVRVEPGSQVTLDLVIDAVPDDRGIIGFEIRVKFDPAVLELSGADHEFLLAAKGTYEPFEGLGDPLPDTDGLFSISIADLESRPPEGGQQGLGQNIESGPGVLSRLTFTAKAAGVSTVAPAFDPPSLYPGIIDNQNKIIEVNSIGKATVAVGQDCPSPPQATPVTDDLPPLSEVYPTPSPSTSPAEGSPTPAVSIGAGSPSAAGSPAQASSGSPTPGGPNGGNNSEDGGDGTNTSTVLTVVGLAAAGIALAGGGGWLLLRRRRENGGT